MVSESNDVGRISCVVVFTNRGKDRLLGDGGSQSWRMDASRASKCKYVICVQNRNDSWGKPTAEHKQAFLIAEIAGIEPSEEMPDRQKIVFKRYAEISVPNKWDGNRNPVAYMKLADFGINSQKELDALGFNKLFTFSVGLPPPVSPGDDYEAAVSEVEHVAVSEEGSPRAQELTIEQAKQGLAKKFGVRVDQVEILIRA